MEKIKIYKLVDPRTNKIRYVGKTKNTLHKRYTEHLYRAKQGHNSKVYSWIRKLLKLNLKPLIELIEYCESNNWEEREKYWISYYPNLTNISEGGITYFGKQYVQSPNFVSSVIKKVIKYDMNGNFICIYDSITIASEGNKNLRRHISGCCNNKRQSAGGFQWRYYTENYPLKIDAYKKRLSSSVFVKGHTLNKGIKIKESAKLKMSEAKKVKVINVKTGEIYDSILDASKKLKINYKTLNSQLFFNSPSRIINYLNKESKSKRPIKKVPVKDTITNDVYSSISECQKKINISRSKIRSLLTKKIIVKI
jgi:hypothetical protein